jgi:hypothetical protein
LFIYKYIGAHRENGLKIGGHREQEERFRQYGYNLKTVTAKRNSPSTPTENYKSYNFNDHDYDHAGDLYYPPSLGLEVRIYTNMYIHIHVYIYVYICVYMYT